MHALPPGGRRRGRTGEMDRMRTGSGLLGRVAGCFFACACVRKGKTEAGEGATRGGREKGQKRLAGERGGKDGQKRGARESNV